MKKEFKLSDEQLAFLLDACKPTVAIMLNVNLPGPQENANAAWIKLGKDMGFKPFSGEPCPGKDNHYFMAEPI